MRTLTEIRRCINVLAQTPKEDWAKTFVELRMNFYRNYQNPFVFSTRFGRNSLKSCGERWNITIFSFPAPEKY